MILASVLLAGSFIQPTTTGETTDVSRAKEAVARRRFDDAVPLARAALQAAESTMGADSIAAARAAHLLFVASAERGGLSPGDFDISNARALATFRRTKGEFDPETLALERAAIRVLIQQGRGEAALELAERHAGRVRSNLGVAANDRAAALLELGIALQNRSRLRPARAAFDEALALNDFAESAGPSAMRAELLRLRARVDETLGDTAKASEDFERARRDLGSTAAGTFEEARVLADLSRVKARMRSFAEAESLARESSSIIERVYGADHVDGEIASSALAWCRLSSGHPHDAALGYEKGLQLLEAHLDAKSPRLMIALANTGRAYGRDGDLEKALAVFERSHEINRSFASPVPAHAGDMLLQIGNIEGQLGRLAPAYARFAEASVALTEVYGPDSPQLAPVFDRLSATALVLGQLDDAKRHADRALAVLLHQEPRNEERVTFARLAVARVARARKDPLARSLLEECLAARTKLQGPGSLEVAAVEVDLADLAAEENRFEDAAGHAGRAAAIYRAKTPRHHQLDDAEEVMAIAAGRLGRWDEAVHLAEGIVGRARDNLGVASVSYGNGERLLATAYAGRGRNSDALDSAIRSERVRIETVSLATRHLGDSDALAFLATRRSTRSLALLLSLAQPDRVNEVLEVSARSRALVLDGVTARHRANVIAADTAIRALQQEASSAQSAYAALAISTGSGDPARDRAALQDARERKDNAERALGLQSPAFSLRESESGIGLPQILAAIPGDAALVSIFETWSKAEAPPPLVTPREADRRYLAFVSTSTGVIGVVDLGEARPIDGLIAERLAAQRRFAADPGRSRKQAERRDLEIGERLSERLWQPIAARIGVRRSVFIVPDGAIGGVNFMSLVSREGKFLVEAGFRFHVLSTERDLLPKAAAVNGVFIAVGAPDFGGSSRSSGSERASQRATTGGCAVRDFAPLPSTLEETRAVVRSLNADQRKRARVLTGSLATEESLKSLPSAPEVLHLATHSYAAPSCASGTAAEVDEFDRLRLSGIALAGANRSGADGGKEDGILTGEEAASLNLVGTKWVVLSACESTGAETAPGEGLLGIRRAFQSAGARTVISSLWAIEDESTMRFMALLYQERFRRGRTTMDAMNATARQILGERRREGESAHPLFWAGFVAAGDWR
jgi:CHAT domain-containing protein/tetratricopeptide (TPR) repeat protein